MPVVIDGVISAAAAVIAAEIAPDCTGYMLSSHVSEEPAGQAGKNGVDGNPPHRLIFG